MILQTFTTDSEIDISFQQIEEVNAASNSDIQFGQNLALFFYGANTLREMSVKGVATHRFKNAKARPGISPKKLTFIHGKRITFEINNPITKPIF